MEIIGSFEKFFGGYIRREYTRNMIDGYGDYYPCVIHGLRVIKAHSLMFQCTLSDGIVEHGKLDQQGGYPGAGFLAPIEAFCHRIPDKPRTKGAPVDMTYIQPWDCFSNSFGVHEFDYHRRMKCLILPDRREARYRFSIDFADSALAEWNEQHKHLHIVDMADGSIGAFPNNRILWIEPAMYDAPTTKRPDFISLDGEWRAE